MAAGISWCWALLSSWLLSPGAAWFLFFNAIVGAVAVLSWGAHHQGGDGTAVSRRRRLTRSASSMVMERLRSMSTAVFPAFHVQEYNPFQEEDQQAVEEMKKIMEPAVAAGEISCRTPTMAPPPSAPVAEDEDGDDSTVEGPRKSEPEKASEEFPFVVCAERCRRAYGIGEAEEKAEVNARAERFIRQFRADLKLERINSIILNNRRCAGAGAAPAPVR